jgi:CheY-like chemotaxis protein
MEKERAMASRSSRREPCVLIVDDEPDIREAMRDAIASWQCAALTAASGQEALDILDHRCVDVVLCDLVMPDMNGAETLRGIKQRAPDLPVIMMSAMMTPDLRRHLCAIGAQTCLAKPMGRKELALALFPWCVPAKKSS